MADEDRLETLINPIERSLLSDLVGLYESDKVSVVHEPAHGKCIPCSKEAIVRAISRYKELDDEARAHNYLILPAPAE